VPCRAASRRCGGGKLQSSGKGAALPPHPSSAGKSETGGEGGCGGCTSWTRSSFDCFGFGPDEDDEDDNDDDDYDDDGGVPWTWTYAGERGKRAVFERASVRSRGSGPGSPLKERHRRRRTIPALLRVRRRGFALSARTEEEKQRGSGAAATSYPFDPDGAEEGHPRDRRSGLLSRRYLDEPRTVELSWPNSQAPPLPGPRIGKTPRVPPPGLDGSRPGCERQQRRRRRRCRRWRRRQPRRSSPSWTKRGVTSYCPRRTAAHRLPIPCPALVRF
jgi:hypothetical protein